MWPQNGLPVGLLWTSGADDMVPKRRQRIKDDTEVLCRWPQPCGKAAEFVKTHSPAFVDMHGTSLTM